MPAVQTYLVVVRHRSGTNNVGWYGVTASGPDRAEEIVQADLNRVPPHSTIPPLGEDYAIDPEQTTLWENASLEQKRHAWLLP